jgi:EAL and modified HD-GYP domain-containing signal transduction protein
MRALTATLLLSNNEPIKRLLVLKLLVRAAMAKKIALRVPNVDADVAFTAGLFSMIDRLEGVELNVLLKEAGLDTVITEALLEHKGELGKIVSIIQTFEAAKLDKRPLKFVEILNKDYLQSVAWAQEMMSLTDD